MRAHAALEIENTCRSFGITCPMHLIDLGTNTKFCFTKLVTYDVNLFCIKRFILKGCADVERTAQHRTALMVNVRADWADAIWGKDILTQARIAHGSGDSRSV